MTIDELNPANTISISMFGNLELSYGNQQITESSYHSRKMWNLLAYIITYRNKNITQSEFIDVLWPDEGSLNPVNALKTLVYRLRLQLKTISINQDEFIQSSSNSYHWNKALPCIIDVELFETYLKLASDATLDVIKRISLYMKSIDLYKGDFLSNHSSELWATPLITHYRSLYLDAVSAVTLLLESEKMYEEMASICTKAIQIDSFDERFHIILIRALTLQGNNTAALAHYKVTTDMLYKNLGVKPSTELRNLYQQLMKVQKGLDLDLGVIQSELKEIQFEPGAFVCEYGFFQEAYRLEARQAKREGRNVFICLTTITLPNGNQPSLEILNMAMESLLDAIVSCLRRGDVVSRYSGAQYVIMLPSATSETSNMIIERIVNFYNSKNQKSLLRIQYKLEQLDLMN